MYYLAISGPNPRQHPVCFQSMFGKERLKAISGVRPRSNYVHLWTLSANGHRGAASHPGH
jgi:hypothetical protein